MYAERPHILVIDDDARIRTLVSRYLWKQEFVALSAASAEEGLSILQDFDVDLIVCDVMMPGKSGFDFTEILRAGDHRTIPLILLTALGEVENRIEGFEKGADDYLPKPFDPQELVLRIKALLRRSTKKKAPDVLRIGAYHFNAEQSLLENKVDGHKDIRLTELESKLITALSKTPNQPVSREKLATLCEMDGSERAIDVQVTRLRKKIEVDPANPRLLRTVRGKGYLLKVESQ